MTKTHVEADELNSFSVGYQLLTNIFHVALDKIKGWHALNDKENGSGNELPINKKILAKKSSSATKYVRLHRRSLDFNPRDDCDKI